jgi:hypothetical protein
MRVIPSEPGAYLVDDNWDDYTYKTMFWLHIVDNSEQAALKCLYLVTRSLDPTGAGSARWTMRWKPVINAFAITFGDRWPAAETC